MASGRSASTSDGLSPDLGRFAPLARLKEGYHGSVVLLRERESGVLQVGRRLPISTPEQFPALCQKFSLIQNLAHVRIQPQHELLETDTGVWAIADFVLGYPLDYLASQRSQLEVRHVVLWMHQMLEGLQVLHEAQLPMGMIDPSDIVIGVQGATFVDLRMFEHAWPEREA